MMPAKSLVQLRPESRRFFIGVIRQLLTHLCRQGIEEIRYLGFEKSEECAVKLIDDGLLRCIATKCPAGRSSLAFEGFNPFAGRYEHINFYYPLEDL